MPASDTHSRSPSPDALLRANNELGPGCQDLESTRGRQEHLASLFQQGRGLQEYLQRIVENAPVHNGSTVRNLGVEMMLLDVERTLESFEELPDWLQSRFTTGKEADPGDPMDVDERSDPMDVDEPNHEVEGPSVSQGLPDLTNPTSQTVSFQMISLPPPLDARISQWLSDCHEGVSTSRSAPSGFSTSRRGHSGFSPFHLLPASRSFARAPIHLSSEHISSITPQDLSYSRHGPLSGLGHSRFSRCSTDRN